MPDQVVQDIKDRLSVADVVGSYVQLKRAGANFKAVCPFHHEKTPSFQVSPARQVWHCFGCGEGGDIFDFVERYENVGFAEALKILADRAGVKLPERTARDPQAESERETLVRINSYAAKLYHEVLLKDPKAAPARAYLEKRGLRAETVARWQIGYAPDEFHYLEQALVKKNVPLAALVRAGVSAQGERGQIYDRFRGRITFPILDYFGHVVGFSARILDPDAKIAKYINSPETAIYSKGRVLFGLYQAKQAIRRADDAVVVEGQMDCISAHQAGIANVVASSGTALTEDQLQLLGRLTKNLTFCFDGDAAGLVATRRAVELYLGKDFTTKVVDLGDAKDPDELIRKDPALFSDAIAKARLFLDYYIDKSFQNYAGTVDEKKRISKDVLPLVGRLTDPLERDHYVNLLARKLGTSGEVLTQALSLAARPAPPKSAAKKAGSAETAPPEPDAALQKTVIGGLLSYPDFVKTISPDFEPADFTDSACRELAAALVSGSEPTPEQRNSSLAKEAQFVVESLLNEYDGNEFAVHRELKKSFSLLRLKGLKTQQVTLTASIRAAEGQHEQATVQQLNQQFAQLAALRTRLEKNL